MTKSALSAARRRPLQLRCADNDSSSLWPHLCVGQQCLRSSASLPLLRLLPASCPALLPSFALTPVIGWFLTVSLLLLSHSDASVVAVENRYPLFVLFLLLPRLKYHGTKRHTGLALQDPGKKTQNKMASKKPPLFPLP